MQLNINTDIEIDDTDLEARIITAAADLLVNRDYTVRHQMVSKAIEAALQERAVAEVDKFFAAGIQPVDHIGDPKGPRLLVSDFLALAVKDWMDVRVNDRGEPSRDSFGSHSTRGEWLLKKHAIEGIANIATKEVRDLRESAKLQIKQTVAAAVQAALLKGV